MIQTEEIFNDRVANVVLQVGPDLLLVKRASRLTFPRQWALPGGFVDKKEKSHVAARRELYEEIGIDQLILPTDKRSERTVQQIGGMGIQIAYYFKQVEPEVLLNIRPDPDEVMGYAIFSPLEVSRLIEYGMGITDQLTTALNIIENIANDPA